MNRLVAFMLAAFVTSATSIAPPALADDQETQIGQQEYATLSSKGEIIARPNPLYDTLDPIAARIKSIADPQYAYPFHFILVHEKDPNAFAVPGGNVYVTDSLMHFVANREELAGVLCHETSHDIHHDVVDNERKEQPIAVGAAILAALLGGHNAMANSALGMGEQLEFGKFSRAVETNADLKGSDTCAEAGYNPWGMVWLFEKFAASGNGGSVEMLSDHPSDDHRVRDLENHFEANPGLFSRYSRNIGSATSLDLSNARARRAPSA